MTAYESDLTTLRRAVLENPPDDAPRLVYADALRDAGDHEWANLIAGQFAGGRARVCLNAIVAGTTDSCHGWDRCPDCAFLEARGLPAVLLSGHDDYVVRRGFVDEVTLPLVRFVGGTCPSCRGHGRHADHSEAECTTCGGKTGTGKCGTGKIVGIATALFASHPVTRVRLTDVQPVRLDRYRTTTGKPAKRGHMVERYAVWEFPVGELPVAFGRHPLPWDIYDHMNSGVTHEEWVTEAEALAALSTGCVRYGRKLAGLPDLPSGPTPAAVG